MRGKVTLRYLVNTAAHRQGFPFSYGVCVNLSRYGEKLGKAKSYRGKPLEMSFKLKVRFTALLCGAPGMYTNISICFCASQDYWLSLLYKKLVGTKVLQVGLAGADKRKLRVYLHCTNSLK